MFYVMGIIGVEENVDFSVGVFLTLLCAFNLWSHCFGCSSGIDTVVLIDLGHSEQKGEAAADRKRGFV
jgi:hypothetical protein